LGHGGGPTFRGFQIVNGCAGGAYVAQSGLSRYEEAGEADKSQHEHTSKGPTDLSTFRLFNGFAQGILQLFFFAGRKT
jgi:hypothetical protein